MADEFVFKASIDVGDVISGLQNLVSSVESNSAKITTALQRANAQNAEAAATLQAFFNTAKESASGAIAPLVAAQNEYLESTTQLAVAEANYNAAEQQKASALELVQSIESSAAASTQELVIATQLLQEASIQAAQTTQQLGEAIEKSQAAESGLAAARTAAAIAGEQLAASSQEILSNEASLAELQQNLAAANQKLATASQELSSVQSNLAASAGEYIAAQQQMQSASSEVEAAQSALAGKIQSLEAALNEQKSILSSAETSWVEYAQAEQQVAEITQQLATVQAQTSSAIAASTQATTTAAEGQVELNVVSAQTIATLAALQTILSQVGNVSAGTAGAFQFLQSNAATATSTSQQFQAAVNTLNTALRALNIQLQGTAGNLQLVAQQAQNAGGGVNNASSQLSALGGLMAYIGGRSAALALGLGQLGFALGSLGRSAAFLAPLFQGLFVVAIPILLIEAVTTLIDKFEKLQERIRKNAAALDDLAASQILASQAAELQNLKLEDEISNLEGRPTANRLKEALIEINIETQKLSKSLEDAIEKTLELMRAGEVGFWDHFLTGQAKTTGIESALKAPLESLKDAMREADLARLSGNKDAQDAADKNVEIARSEAQRVLNEERNKINQLEAERKRSLTSTQYVSSPGLQGATTATPGLSEADAAKQVTSEFRAANAVIREGQILLDEQVQRTKLLATFAKDVTKAADEKNASESRSRTRTTEEADIKAAEDDARTQAQIARQSADAQLKEIEAGIKRQVEAQVAGGTLKAQAVLDSLPPYETALRAHTAALLRALGDEHDAQVDALNRQRSLDESTLVGPQRDAALRRVNQQLKDEDNKYQSERENIIADGNAAILTLDAEADQRRIEVRNDTYRRFVDAEREGARTLVQTARDEASGQIDQIKAANETSLRLIQDREQLNFATAQQGLAQRLALYEQEKAAVALTIANEIGALEDRRSRVAAELQEAISAGNVPTDDIKRLRQTYEELSVAISKAATNQEQLDIKIEQAKLDAAINQWKEYQKTVTDFTNQSISSINGFVENVLTSNNTIYQSFNSMFVAIERSFIQMILKMIEQTELFKALQGKVQGIFAEVFKLPAQPGTAVPTAVGTGAATAAGATGATEAGIGAGTTLAQQEAVDAQRLAANQAVQSQIIAQQASTNSTLAGMYAQDNASYLTGQSAKVTAHVTGEATQTSTTAAGESTRAGLNSAATASHVTQTTVKTTAHAAGEATQTASTAAGESSRTGIGIGGTIAHLARSIAKTAAHAASEIGMTAATVAGEASRTAIAIGHFIGFLVRTIAKVAAHIAGEAGMTAATIAGESARAASSIASHIASIMRAAARAAAHAFMWVMEEVPFPVNIALAPATAAATFAAVAAYATIGGTAAKGAKLARDTVVAAHEGELIIPKRYVAPILSLAASVGMGVAPAMATSSAVSLNNSVQEMALPSEIRTSFDRISQVSNREVATHVEEQVISKLGTGSSLDTAVQGQMEQAFGVSFAGVNIHTGSQANELNRQMGAVAFTVGRDIFFSDGSYQPKTYQGQHLLAHELTHVVQNSGSRINPTLTMSHPSDAHEVEARASANSIMSLVTRSELMAKQTAVKELLTSNLKPERMSFSGISGASLTPAAHLSRVNMISNTAKTVNAATNTSEVSGPSSVTVKLGDVNAVDHEGVTAALRRQQRELAKIVSRQLKTGHINLKNIKA